MNSTSENSFLNNQNSRSNFAAVIVCAGLFIACLIPFHVHPFRSLYNELAIIIGLFFAFFVLAWQPRGSTMDLLIPKASILPLGLIVVLVLNLVFRASSVWSELIFPLIYLLLFLFAIILGANITANQQQRAYFCLVFSMVNVALAVLSVSIEYMQIAGVDGSPLMMSMGHGNYLVRAYANIAQPNQLALLLCFGMASTWYLYQINKLPAQWAVSIAGFILTGVVLTQSRIGWIIFPLFAVVLMTTQNSERKINRLALMALLLVYFGMVFFLPFVSAGMGYVGGSVIEHVGGRSERAGLWQQAWHMAATHPWVGVGWFGYGTEQVRIAADFNSTTYAEHAHNIVLNFAAEMGWPVTLAIMLGVSWWIVQTCVLAKSNSVSLYASLCFIAAGVHSMVEFPLWYGYILFPIGMLIGMSDHLRWEARVMTTKTALVKTLVIIGLMGMSLVIWDYQRVVRGFNVLRWEQTPSVASLQKLEKPALTLFPEFFDYFKLMRIEPREGMSAEEIAYVEKWTPRFGFVHILNKMAEIDLLNGEPDKAVRLMQTLQRLHPYDYPEYFDYWQAKGALDPRYKAAVAQIPKRDAP